MSPRSMIAMRVMRHPRLGFQFAGARLKHVCLCLKRFSAPHSVCSPPPCGEGMGVGVLQRITARPPPRRFAPTLPTRGRVGPSSPLALDYTLPEYTLARRGTIERQVERQHVHPRLAQEAEGTTLDMLLDELPHAIFRQIAGFRNSGHLEEGRCGRNVRIEAAAGGRDEIDGDC